MPKGNQEMVAAAFRTIFAQATKEEAATQWDHVRATFAERFGKAAALMGTAKEEVLAFVELHHFAGLQPVPPWDSRLLSQC